LDDAGVRETTAPSGACQPEASGAAAAAGASFELFLGRGSRTEAVGPSDVQAMPPSAPRGARSALGPGITLTELA